MPLPANWLLKTIVALEHVEIMRGFLKSGISGAIDNAPQEESLEDEDD